MSQFPQKPSEQNNLAAWLSDPRTDKYFGRGFALRADVLAHILIGTGTLAAIAHSHGVSKQSLTRHARRVREIYGIGKQPVDSPH